MIAYQTVLHCIAFTVNFALHLTESGCIDHQYLQGMRFFPSKQREIISEGGDKFLAISDIILDNGSASFHNYFRSHSHY